MIKNNIILSVFLICFSCSSKNTKLDRNGNKIAEIIADYYIAISASNQLDFVKKDSIRQILVTNTLAHHGLDTTSLYKKLYEYAESPFKLVAIYDSAAQIVKQKKELLLKKD